MSIPISVQILGKTVQIDAKPEEPLAVVMNKVNEITGETADDFAWEVPESDWERFLFFPPRSLETPTGKRKLFSFQWFIDKSGATSS